MKRMLYGLVGVALTTFACAGTPHSHLAHDHTPTKQPSAVLDAPIQAMKQIFSRHDYNTFQGRYDLISEIGSGNFMAFNYDEKLVLYHTSTRDSSEQGMQFLIRDKIVTKGKQSGIDLIFAVSSSLGDKQLHIADDGVDVYSFGNPLQKYVRSKITPVPRGTKVASADQLDLVNEIFERIINKQTFNLLDLCDMDTDLEEQFGDEFRESEKGLTQLIRKLR